MGRLIFLFFMLPWWVYIPASIGVYWVGERAYEQVLENEAERAAALAQPMPAVVDLAEFDLARDIHAADEVHVTGWMDSNLAYELIKSRNGVTTGKRYMYPMFGPTEPTSAREVRAALMLTKAQYELFMERGDAFIVGLTDADKLVFTFNGYGKTSVTMSYMATDAIKELGLVKSADFFYIEPFFEGREAALSSTSGSDQTRLYGWIAAALVAMIGVVKRIMSLRRRPVSDEAPAPGLKSRSELAAYTPPPPEDDRPASGFAVPEGVSDDTPLGRLARKSRAQPAGEPLHHTAHAAAAPDEDGGHDPAGNAGYDAPGAEAPGYESGVQFEEPGTGTYAYQEDGHADTAAETRPQSSAGAFYAKLALAMLLVGGLAYDPSLLKSALPAVGVAVVLFTVAARIGKLGRGGRKAAMADDLTPRHTRRPDAGVRPGVASGLEMGSPVQSARRERGVI